MLIAIRIAALIAQILAKKKLALWGLKVPCQCSQTTHDRFRSYLLLLPTNSSARCHVRVGKHTDLCGMSQRAGKHSSDFLVPCNMHKLTVMGGPCQ